MTPATDSAGCASATAANTVITNFVMFQILPVATARTLMRQGCGLTGCNEVRLPLTLPLGLKLASSLMTYSFEPLSQFDR